MASRLYFSDKQRCQNLFNHSNQENPASIAPAVVAPLWLLRSMMETRMEPIGQIGTDCFFLFYQMNQDF
jgi:hypothetical protein